MHRTGVLKSDCATKKIDQLLTIGTGNLCWCHDQTYHLNCSNTWRKITSYAALCRIHYLFTRWCGSLRLYDWTSNPNYSHSPVLETHCSMKQNAFLNSNFPQFLRSFFYCLCIYAFYYTVEKLSWKLSRSPSIPVGMQKWDKGEISVEQYARNHQKTFKFFWYYHFENKLCSFQHISRRMKRAVLIKHSKACIYAENRRGGHNGHTFCFWSYGWEAVMAASVPCQI